VFGDLSLPALIANVPALLIGFAFHEFAHAWVADRLGDPTPRSQGRLTLNPVAHLDFFGALMALLFRFGWAKPVQINPRYFRVNPVQGRMLVAMAGPLMNLLVAFVTMLVTVFALRAMQDEAWSQGLAEVLWAIILMNLGLGIFNLLPIPPLDGFAILGGLVPARLAVRLYALEQYGMIILALVLFTDVVGRILGPVMRFLANSFYQIAIFFSNPFFGS